MTNDTQKILITGGSGFIGTNLVEYYARLGWEVLSLDSIAPRNPEHAEYFRHADLLDAAGLLNIFAEFQPDYVVHLAARTDLNETQDIKGYDANIQGVRNVIDALKPLKNLRRVIFTSSMLVCRYGYVPSHETDYCPSTLYGQSKVLTEQIIHEAPLPFEWLIVRPTSIWGPWFGPPYNLFFKFILAGRFFHPGKRAGCCTYGFVGNAVYQIDALLRAAGVCGKTFYLGDTPPNNLSEWADEIAQLAGRRKSPVIPFWVVKSAAIFGDMLSKCGISFPMTSFRLGNMTTDCVMDLSDTYQAAPNPPFTRQQGIEITLEWLKECDKSEK